MITAHDFAASTISAGYRFGLGNNTHTHGVTKDAVFANALRRIAKEIDAGNIVPQKATVASVATPDEFVTTTITLELVEKVKA